MDLAPAFLGIFVKKRSIFFVFSTIKEISLIICTVCCRFVPGKAAAKKMPFFEKFA